MKRMSKYERTKAQQPTLEQRAQELGVTLCPICKKVKCVCVLRVLEAAQRRLIHQGAPDDQPLVDDISWAILKIKG